MTDSIIDYRTPDGKSPTDTRLLRSPIDFIAEDHLRLRTMCAQMDCLAAEARPGARDVVELCDYMRHELPLLLADEDEDLIPRVLDRAEPDDDLPKLARRLDDEHGEIERLAATLRGALCRSSGGVALSGALRKSLCDLAAAVRRHLILENAVLLPLARARLTYRDLCELRHAMLRRRGLHDLFSDWPAGALVQ